MRKKRHRKRRTALLFVEVLSLVLAIGLGVIFFMVEKRKEEESLKIYEAIALTEEEIGRLKGSNVSEKAEDHNAVVEEGAVDRSRYGEILADEEMCREQHIYPMDTVSADQVTLLFAGDVGLAEGYANLGQLLQRGGDINTAFDENTLLTMKNADIFMVNNEFTYTNRGEPTEGKQYTFRCNPEYVKYLFEMGVDIVSLANNHTYDFGEVSLLDTLDTLNAVSMPYVGAGYDLQDAMKPTYFIANDMRIAFVSATQIERVSNPDTKGATESSPGTFRCWYDDRVLDVIKEAKECSDYVVVYIHWGTELEVAPDWAQDELAPKLASAGADLIVGDHPHVLQKIDFIGDTPVIYSLGNYWFNSKTLDTGLFEVVLGNDGQTKSVRFIPAIQSGCRTNIVTAGEAARIIEYMKSISTGVSIDDEGYISNNN